MTSKQGDGERIHDPAAYKARSKPRPLAEVEASFRAFGAELRELCAKHGILELVYCMMAAVEGDEQLAGSSGYVGSADAALTMSANLYATQQVAHINAARERVADLNAQVRMVVARETGEEDEG